MADALKFLSYRQHSEQEIASRLYKKHASTHHIDEQIQVVLARLKELNLLNDASVAESLARHYHHKGDRYIVQELRQRGIANDLITQALQTIDVEADRAFVEARKKVLNLEEDNLDAVKQKLFRFLTGRGFSHTSFKQAFRQLQEMGLLQVRY